MTVGSRRTRRTGRCTTSQLLTLGLVAAVVLLLPAPSSAQGSAKEPAPVNETRSLRIIDQATFVESESSLWFDLAIDLTVVTPGTPPFVSVIVHGALDSEDDLDGALPPVINRTELLPVSRLERLTDVRFVGDDRYRVSVPIRGGPQEGDQPRLLLPAAGIYPVTIELRTEEGTLAATTTHVVRLDPSAGNTSGRAPTGGTSTGALALVLRISPDGPFGVEEATELLRAHPLLSENPDLAFTVWFEPGVLDELRADREAALALSEAIAGRPVLASPEPDLDPSALAEIGQADFYREAVDLVRSDLVALGFVPADGVHVSWSLPTLDGLAVLDDLGIRSILDPDGRATGTGTIRAGGTAVRAIAADRELSALLSGEGGAHRANRLLTALALRDLNGDQQNSETIPVIVTPRPRGAADDLATTIDALVNALEQPGAPDTVLVSELIGERGGATIRAAERPAQDLRPISTVLAAVRAKVGTYESFHPGAPQLRRRIPGALSSDSSPQERLSMLEGLDATLNAGLAVIELHDGQPVTMAARSAPIPVVVESSADGPRQVLLRLRSDRVSSADDERLLEIGPGTSSIDVELVARSLGVSPLEVSVWTPDGSIQLAATQFEIRSTAIPGLGLALTGGTVGLLGAWWVVDARKRRKLLITAE